MSTYQEQFDNFFEKAWENRGDIPLDDRDAKNKFKKKLQDLNKKFGQLIAKSWLHERDEEGKKIRDVLLRGIYEQKDNTKEIIEFFKENYQINIDTDFAPSGSEIKRVIVNWDSFAGSTEEKAETYYLPYPPRPPEVTDEQLEEWVNDQDNDHPYPTTPYIPLTGF